MNINSIKYKYHDVIAETCKTIFEDVFDEDEIADEIEYDADWQPACDAHILNIFVNWKTERTRVGVSYTLDTGTGGLYLVKDGPKFRLKTTKDAEFSNVSISKTILDENDNEIAEFEWNGDTRKWRRSLTLNESCELNDLSPELKHDSDRILKWIKNQDNGFKTTTQIVAKEVRKCNYDQDYLEKLDNALILGAIKRGFLLYRPAHEENSGVKPYNLEFTLKKDC